MKVFRLYYNRRNKTDRIITKDFLTMEQYENWYKRNSGILVKKLLVKDI